MSDPRAECWDNTRLADHPQTLVGALLGTFFLPFAFTCCAFTVIERWTFNNLRNWDSSLIVRLQMVEMDSKLAILQREDVNYE